MDFDQGELVIVERALLEQRRDFPEHMAALRGWVERGVFQQEDLDVATARFEDMCRVLAKVQAALQVTEKGE